MTFLPKTEHPLLIRTDFENQKAWEAICEAVRAPVRDGADAFYANLDFLEQPVLRNAGKEDLMARVPEGYPHSFLLVADRFATEQSEFPILVIDLHHDPGRTFRAIPSQIQGIENNLSIANMDFFEFADSVDPDGVFRGFSSGEK